uniref:Uncharacterized protein n=1 Tax=Pseudomonas fluorescens (strain SBW25) TaxID=216595 RepID=A0A0G4E5I0_PSEFS|nr:hypothetical protein [Pseudomonas fluorescens]CEK42283.1 hypothetical protein PQBR57_0330 [Pseudomonas fluorescens SBW25]
MANVQKITFVDSGQDFTEFFVREGVVIDCQPYQGSVWVGTKVVANATVGQFIEIVPRATGRATFLQHKVEAVETLTADQAAEVEQYGRKWATMLKLEPAALNL